MIEILSYTFFQKAILTALLASISCGIIGSYVVSKRIVFISDGITHASFGGIGLGYFLGLNPIITAMVFGILSAFGIRFISSKGNIREDSTIGIFLALGMAVGIIFIYLTPGYAPDLSSYLFGNILTVTSNDIVLSSVITLVSSAGIILFYKEILFVAFDEQYAKIMNLKVELINYSMIALVALVVVVNIRIAGVILIISLLTIPQTTALLISKKFNVIIILSIIIGLISSIAGLYLSFYLNIPSGASIVFSEAVIFIIVKLAYLSKRG